MAATADERNLVKQLRTGSREAFEQFLNAYERKVFDLTSRMVGAADAEDVAQDALVQICRSISGFRGDSGLSTWVYRVAMNVCLEHRRKLRPELVLLEDDESELQADPADGPEIAAVRNQIKGHVGAAIEELPELQRAAVVLHELQGLTYCECARVLGCPVGTVKSRLSTAFKKLRTLLSDYAAEGEVAI